MPDEAVYIYFAVKNPDGPIPASYDKFVDPKGIIYKGGIAIAASERPGVVQYIGFGALGISVATTIVGMIAAVAAVTAEMLKVKKSKEETKPTDSAPRNDPPEGSP